jgi:hypothetical protein
MKSNVVRMKISENIADPDFEDNIANIEILSDVGNTGLDM